MCDQFCTAHVFWFILVVTIKLMYVYLLIPYLIAVSGVRMPAGGRRHLLARLLPRPELHAAAPALGGGRLTAHRRGRHLLPGRLPGLLRLLGAV